MRMKIEGIIFNLIEPKHKIGFIISSCINTDVQLRVLTNNIENINKYHPECNIIIIDDSNKLYNLDEHFLKNNKVYIIDTYTKGSGDSQSIKAVYDNTLFDTGIMMHDSMIPLNRLEIVNFNNPVFLWHWTNHRVHWDIMMHQLTEEDKILINTNNNEIN